MKTSRYRLVNAISTLLGVCSGIFGAVGAGGLLFMIWGNERPAVALWAAVPLILLGTYLGVVGGFFGIMVPLHYLTRVPLHGRQMVPKDNILAQYSRLFGTVARKSRQLALWEARRARTRPRIFPWGSLGGIFLTLAALYPFTHFVKDLSPRTLSSVAPIASYFALAARPLFQHRLAAQWLVDIDMTIAMLALGQFMLYGGLLNEARERGHAWKVVAILATLHAIAVAVYFAGF
jgi:hypothetical protein